jgi:hypothetical protein
MDIIKNIIKDISAQHIALVALGVSIISLFLSISKFRLSEAEKRTEIMMKLLDTKIRFERCLRIYQERLHFLKDEDCLKKWRNIKEIDRLYKKIERMAGFLGPVGLESLMPDVTGLFKKAEELESETHELEQMCLKCTDDSSNESDNAPDVKQNSKD